MKIEDVRLAFKIIPGGKSAIGHQFLQCYRIFDIKMEDFGHETQLVAGGHITKSPTTIKYTSFVLRAVVYIAGTAALNYLEVKAEVIMNTHVYVTARENSWTILGL